jgi:hypothetical protein
MSEVDKILSSIAEGYTRSEVILALNNIRAKCGKRPIGISTFYRWCDELSITPKRMFTKSEMERLGLLAIHYAMGGKKSNMPNI